MKKTTLYTYLGVNGTITSPVRLEGIYSVKSVLLEADAHKTLTKDGGITTVDKITVPEDEADFYTEVNSK